MALSQPLQGIGNQGDEMRLVLAGTEFVNPCCAHDPRVRASFDALGAAATGRAAGGLPPAGAG